MNGNDMTSFAPNNDEGLRPYVVETYMWGKMYKRIEYAPNLTAAKAAHGWTRQLHTSKHVRRARVADMTDTSVTS